MSSHKINGKFICGTDGRYSGQEDLEVLFSHYEAHFTEHLKEIMPSFAEQIQEAMGDSALAEMIKMTIEHSVIVAFISNATPKECAQLVAKYLGQYLKATEIDNQEETIH